MAWGPIEIPTKAQGVLVLSDTWIFSTSRFRDKPRQRLRRPAGLRRRGRTSPTVPYRCFQSVAMTQELVGYNGRTYLLNESGADGVRGRSHPRHPQPPRRQHGDPAEPRLVTMPVT